MKITILIFCVLLWLTEVASAASGIFRDGIGAQSMSLGGADVGRAEGAIGSFGANPAGASQLESPTLDLGFAGALVEGRFNDSVNHDARLRTPFGALPEGAFGLRLGTNKVGIVIGAAPEAALEANWLYFDPPGGADGNTTYGLQRYQSEIILLRSGVSIGWEITPKLSIGAGGGALYNKNTLNAPYIFQTQPALKGAKTLLDLETDGFGPYGQAGVLFRPCQSLQLGASYTSPTTVYSHGVANGNAGVQFANLGLTGARPDFHYNAEVDTHFPQVVSGGAFWRVHPRWNLLGQVDWINWQDSFDQLPVKLTQGNNASLNGLVGSTTLLDNIPLNWRDQVVYRAGVEFNALTNLSLRTGYSYGRTPVVSETLTPLTAAIMEHTLTFGVGYQVNRFSINLAYQWNIPSSEHVGQSALRSGEYSNSTTKIAVHWLALTISTRF